MRSLAEETKVAIAGVSDGPLLLDKPVFRYDDQPRQLTDATLWAWTDSGRPAAFLKVEAMDRSVAKWGFCFASASERLLTSKWPKVPPFNSSEPGVHFALIPEAKPVAERGAERKRQLRALGREFSAQIAKDPTAEDREEMRLLSTPLMEYADPESKLPLGAVFGFASNGTNPDMLLLLEARPVIDRLAWHFAPLRMTDGALTLNHGKKMIWQTTFVGGGLPPFATWTYFETRRDDVSGQ